MILAIQFIILVLSFEKEVVWYEKERIKCDVQRNVSFFGAVSRSRSPVAEHCGFGDWSLSS